MHLGAYTDPKQDWRPGAYLAARPADGIDTHRLGALALAHAAARLIPQSLPASRGHMAPRPGPAEPHLRPHTHGDLAAPARPRRNDEDRTERRVARHPAGHRAARRDLAVVQIRWALGEEGQGR